MHQQFEYKCVQAFDHARLVERLNELGEQGWELVALCDERSQGFKAYLKRKKQEVSRKA